MMDTALERVEFSHGLGHDFPAAHVWEFKSKDRNQPGILLRGRSYDEHPVAAAEGKGIAEDVLDLVGLFFRNNIV